MEYITIKHKCISFQDNTSGKKANFIYNRVLDVVYNLLSEIWQSILESRTSKLCIIWEYGRQIKMTFSFSLCAIPLLVKIIDSGLHFYFLFLLYVIFFFFFFFFPIFRTTQVRVYQSHCHISHKLMA